MIQKLFFVFLSLTSIFSYGQSTFVYNNPSQKYEQAKEFFNKGDVAFAHPLFLELKNDIHKDAPQYSYLADGVNFYAILCGLNLQLASAKDEAVLYIKGNESGQAGIMSFHLAHYFYLTAQYEEVVYYYNRAGITHLTNEQLAQSKFERAYAYYSLKNYSEAEPLFNEIHQISSNKYYLPANYYYGLLAYQKGHLDEALKAFLVTENDISYKRVTPYFVAAIYHAQGKKDDALAYGESALQSGLDFQYANQLKLLLGQLYFEKKDFARALPYLQAYADNAPSITKEVLYELSYAQYMQGQLDAAILGLRQLSSEKDEMGQNSMYILGDIYLKKGDKANARNAFQYGAYNNSNLSQQRVSLFNYAKLSYELGYQDLAMKELKHYLNTYPNSENEVEAKSLLVAILANSNNYDEALALYNSISSPALNLQKAYPSMLFGKATNLINDNRLSTADSFLIKAAASKYNEEQLPYINFWRGEIAYKAGNFSDAVRYFSNYLSYNPKSLGDANPSAARYNLGYSYFQMSNFKQALAQFEIVGKAIVANTNQINADAYLRSADCYYMLRDFAKANQMYQRFVEAGLPGSDYAMYQQAMIAGIKSNNEKISVLNSLKTQFPKSGLVDDANMEIAQAYISAEKFPDAVPYLEKIIQSGSAGNKPKALSTLGLAYFNANKNAEALQAYKRLLTEFPNATEADEAQEVVKDIFIEDGKPDGYLDLMKSVGRTVSVAEADSLTYTAAFNKYEAGNCAEAVKSFSDYTSKFANGRYYFNASYFKGKCQQKAGDWKNALLSYEQVIRKGPGENYEPSVLEAARINYLELKDYINAKRLFDLLYKNAVAASAKLEALRGLVRTNYQLKEYSTALPVAKELLASKNISADDKAIGNLVLGKSQQLAGDCTAAINSFKAVAAVNKSSWGAEARYEIANCFYKQKSLSAAERAAMATIKETGAYDWWVTRSYLLLGDIFMAQKDYFNAKATFESVAKNASIAEIKSEAQAKLDLAIEAEKANSKIQD